VSSSKSTRAAAITTGSIELSAAFGGRPARVLTEPNPTERDQEYTDAPIVPTMLAQLQDLDIELCVGRW
jgi:hypothetical protein